MRALVEISGVTVRTAAGRTLFADLTMRLGRERVALVGRNGGGKSTLLALIAGHFEPDVGRVRTASAPWLVPQAAVDGEESRNRARSHGEERRAALEAARRSGAEILLLDEPTEDLDEAGVAWLRRWLDAWSGCLLVASHDRRLLADFRHFFLVSEAGCRLVSGTLEDLDAELARDHDESEQRYARNLHRLAEAEAHTLHVARRKARKKRYGRCSELDRGTSRMRLNTKRSEAQVSQGRISQLREARLMALRDWSRSTRRMLAVSLSLELPELGELPAASTDVVVLREVALEIAGRHLFGPVDLRLRRERLAVVGPNGSGKTSLFEVLLGRRAPSAGIAWRDEAKIGVIEQGGANWRLDDSLRSYLERHGLVTTPEEYARLVAAHRFPQGLAERPMRSLSPGERARAALICLLRRSPLPELLLLDEPTYSLDLVGQQALVRVLRAWPGGLVVASHDETFLAAIGVDARLSLGGAPAVVRSASTSSTRSPCTASASSPTVACRVGVDVESIARQLARR